MGVETIKRLMFRSYRTTPEMPERFRRRFTLAGIFVWCAMLFALTLGADTSRTMGYQVFTVLGVIMIISLCSTFRFKPRLRFRRLMPRFGTVQQPLRYAIRFQNDGKVAEKDLILIERQRDPRPTFTEFTHAREPGEEKRNAWDRFVGFQRFRFQRFAAGEADILQQLRHRLKLVADLADRPAELLDAGKHLQRRDESVARR